MICSKSILTHSCNCKIYRFCVSEGIIVSGKSVIIIFITRNPIGICIQCKSNLPCLISIIACRNCINVICITVSVILGIRSLREAYKTKVIFHIFKFVSCQICLTYKECTITVRECCLPVVPLSPFRHILILSHHIQRPVKCLQSLV